MQVIDELDKDPITQKIEKLDEVIKSIRDKAKKGEIPLSLIKQYYNDIPLTSRGPTPPKARMEDTNQGQRLPSIGVDIWQTAKGLLTSREIENKNAISEVFATAVARAHQMPAQKQYLLIGSYTNGKLMITTDAEWETKFRPIENNFAGQVKSQPYLHNYYVIPSQKLNRVSNPKYQAALDTFACAAQNFMLMLLQADDDGFGSKLQNKGRIDINGTTELYGIDFGHAYRTANDLVNDLSLDFTLSKDLIKKYKNYSILLDSPPTDKMLGLFYVYQTLSPESKNQIMNSAEQSVIENTIQEYKEYYEEKYPGFQDKIKKIEPGCIEKLTSEYVIQLNAKIDKMISEDLKNSSLDKQTTENNIAELKSLVETIQEQGKKHAESSKALILKFKGRMQKDPHALNALVNLAKLTSYTSSTSAFRSTGEVELKHLKIYHSPNKHHVVWDSYSDTTKENIIFTANIEGADNKEVEKLLQRYFIVGELSYNISVKDNIISFSVPKNKVMEFCKAIDEEKIKNIKPCLTICLHKEYPLAITVTEKLSLLTSVTDENLNPHLDKENLLTKWNHKRLQDGNILIYGIPNDNKLLQKRSLQPLIEAFTTELNTNNKDVGPKINIELITQEKERKIDKFKYAHSQIQFVVTPAQLAKLDNLLTKRQIVHVKKQSSDLKDKLLRQSISEESDSMTIIMRSLVYLTSRTDENFGLVTDDEKYLTKWNVKQLKNGDFVFQGIPNDNDALPKSQLKPLVEILTKQLSPSVAVKIAKQESNNAKHKQLQFELTPQQVEELVQQLQLADIQYIKQKHSGNLSTKLLTQKPGRRPAMLKPLESPVTPGSSSFGIFNRPGSTTSSTSHSSTLKRENSK